MSVVFDTPTHTVLQPDIVAYNRDNIPVLIAEVQAIITDEDAACRKLTHSLQAVGRSVLFGILADKNTTRFYKWDGRMVSPLLTAVPTADLVSVYDPAFLDKPVYGADITSLLAAWLRDFIYHWKFPHPPKAETMDSIGLVAALSGGFVFTN